jgi:hypothetical protein
MWLAKLSLIFQITACSHRESSSIFYISIALFFHFILKISTLSFSALELVLSIGYYIEYFEVALVFSVYQYHH